MIDQKVPLTEPPAYLENETEASSSRPQPEPVQRQLVAPEQSRSEIHPYGYPPEQALVYQGSTPNVEACAGPAEQPLSEYQSGSLLQTQLLAQCARGNHNYEKKHRPMGIILGVLLFPVGLICFITDVQRKCIRCGQILQKEK